MTIAKVLVQLQDLLENPNFESPLNREATNLQEEGRFEEEARLCT
jgi:ubiquitin-protein ligase